VTVELRLTVSRRKRSTVVHVDGRLMTDNLAELRQIVGTVSGHAVIDLTNLLSVDDAGIATLRSLGDGGARLVGASPYVALLLEDVAAGPAASTVRPRARPRGRGDAHQDRRPDA
jgi:anti-anti-sigma regulatory factor